MKLYIIFIAICSSIVFAVNSLYFWLSGAELSWWFNLNLKGADVIWLLAIIVVLNVVIQFALDGIVAYVIHRWLPRKWFDARKKIFKVHSKERAFYDKLKIQKWKDKIPEGGGTFAGFDKSKVSDTSSKYLFEFLTETCIAEVIHWATLLVPVVNLFLYGFRFMWIVALPCSLVNLVIQIPPIMIQRYNRPRLLGIYEMRKKREDKAALAKAQ